MKCYVIMTAIYFPKTHKRAGEPTNFPLQIKHYDKIHTIRSNYKLWAKRFEKIDKGEAYLSVRIWEGKPYQSKQLEIFKYDNTRNIGIEKLEFHEDKDGVCCLYYPLINNFAEPSLAELSYKDGLLVPDFKDWFKNYDLTKPLAIIHFTDFRYTNKKY